jgi:hypothetical protein
MPSPTVKLRERSWSESTALWTLDPSCFETIREADLKQTGLPVPGVPGAKIYEVDSLPDTLEDAVRVGPFSVARPGALLRIMPGIGRFLARDGSTIEVCREEGADPSAVSQFLYGAVRAALIYQRGGFALHGACLVPPGRAEAIAIAAPSGTGKSTLAGELVRRGWSLLGDDLAAIYSEPEGMMVWPSRPGIKLWRDACEGLGIDVSDLDRLPGERDKYTLPAKTQQRPAPLRTIFFLDRTFSDGIVPITGPKRLSLLTENSYRPNYLAALGCVQSHFTLTCTISTEIDLAYLRHEGSVLSCADLVEGHINTAKGDLIKVRSE